MGGTPSRPARRPGVYPRPLQDPLPVWIAVGGTPESAVRAGALGLPLALGIIGGLPERFAPFAELHRRAAREAGHAQLPLSINSHGFVAESADEAVEVSYGPFATMMDRIGRERGWPPMTRQSFEAARSLRGANFVGAPEDLVEKILSARPLMVWSGEPPKLQPRRRGCQPRWESGTYGRSPSPV